MKKIIVAIVCMFMLSACQPSNSDISGSYVLPKELKHCSIHELSGAGNNRTLTVVNCPNSQTTTTNNCGKGCTNSTTLFN